MLPDPSPTQPPNPQVPLPTTDHQGGPHPEQIGRYRILGLLGAGGMGTVYRAHDPQLDRVVALKVPRFDCPPADLPRRIERFRREARAAAQVWHPNVCPIFDVGDHDGWPFVVMALVEGRSLTQQLVTASGCMGASEAVALVRQILDGLGTVHARGIVHRDLKPANILIYGAGRAILTDFGLARPESELGQLTSDGVIMGTPSYMAPEQAAAQAERIDPWTDTYAVGVVLYRLLTGRLPFEGTGMALLAQILRDEPPEPRTFRPDLDPALEAIVLRALRKEPGERYPDAPSFVAALDARGAGAGRRVGSDSSMTPADPLRPIPAHSRRRGVPTSRLIGWLVGGLFATAGMAYLDLGASLLVHGYLLWGFSGWLLTVLLAFGAAAIAWMITEEGYSPKALLRLASAGMFWHWQVTPAGTVWQVKRALRNGVPPDGRDEMGETALMRAAAKGHTEIVKLLLLHGADPTLRNRFGQTALEIAQASGKGDVATLLLNAPVPTGARAENLPRFPLGWALLIAGLLGSVASAGLIRLHQPIATDISPETFVQLLERKQMDSVTIRDRLWVEGVLRDPDPAEVTARGVRDRTVRTHIEMNWTKDGERWTRALQDQAKNGNARIIALHGGMCEYWPVKPWEALLMLPIPLVVALLVRVSRKRRVPSPAQG